MKDISFFRRGTVPRELKDYHAPRAIAHRNMWIEEINALRERDPLIIDGNLTIDQYVFGLEFLLMELDLRVRDLEAKANGI